MWKFSVVGWFVASILTFFPNAVRADLPRFDKVQRKVSAIEERQRQSDANYDLQIAPLRESIQNDQNTLNTIGRSDAFSRSQIQNQISNMRTQLNNLENSKRRAQYEFQKQINQETNRGRWQSRGNTASSNGTPIPEWVSQYRTVDGVIEFLPKMEAGAIPGHVRRYQAEISAIADKIAGEEEKTTRAFEIEWKEKWLVDVRRFFSAWLEEENAKLAKEPEVILAKRVRPQLEAFASRFNEFVQAQEKSIDLEIERLRLQGTKEVRDFLQTSLESGDFPATAETDVRYALSYAKRNNTAMVNELHRQWSGGLGGTTGLLGEWRTLKSQGGVEHFLSPERAAFAPHLAKKTELKERSLRLQNEWEPKAKVLIDPIQADFDAWEKQARESLSAYEHAHVARYVGSQFEIELARRKSFVSALQKAFAERRAVQQELIKSLNERIDTAYDKAVPIPTYWPGIETTFERGTRAWPSEMANLRTEWEAEYTKEKNRQGMFPTIVEQLATETKRYPISIRPEKCEYEYYVELEGERTTLFHHSATGRLPVAQLIGKRSFACDGAHAVVTADSLVWPDEKPQAESSRPADFDPSLGEAAWLANGKKHLQLEIPAPGLTFNRVLVAKGLFYIQF